MNIVLRVMELEKRVKALEAALDQNDGQRDARLAQRLTDITAPGHKRPRKAVDG